jgi:uncharacterized membrane protein YeiH
MTGLSFFTGIDLIAVAVFAITGALAGARKGMDIIGLIWLAAVTGIGGGTVRDLMLDRPVFWINDPTYLAVATAAAVLVFFVAKVPERSDKVLLWLDAAGLAFVAVAGAAKAITFGAPPSVAVLMGVITAAFGGILRDLLVGEPSILMRKEIYVTAALLGALTFVALDQMQVARSIAMLAGIGVGFAIRAGAILLGWTLPGARLGRKGEQ